LRFQRQSYFSISREGVPIRNIADYSPFGVQLDGRTISMDIYRYGFQNQEKDDEIKGAGNSVNYKYRMHDPRVGRFFAVDPLESKYPHNSPYAFSENVVINCIELEGLEKINHMVYSKKEKAWKISWTETDNNLKENVNAYHHFNSQGENSYTTVKPWKKSSGNSGTVYFPGNIKPTDENRTMMYHMFESTENAKKSQDQLMLDAKVSNSVAKDATYYGKFEGNYDGGDGGGIYSGLKNMYKAADGLDEIGDNLGYAPTGVTQAGSLAFSGAADILRSIADYNTLDIKSASMNTGIRIVTFGINEKIDNVIDKSKLEETEKYIIKEVSGKATDALKEKSTIKPEKN